MVGEGLRRLANDTYAFMVAGHLSVHGACAVNEPQVTVDANLAGALIRKWISNEVGEPGR